MRRRMWGLGPVAVVTAVTSIASCRQLVGITDTPSEDLVTGICGLPYGTNTCASCVNTNCCSESTACAADPVCAAYEGCLGNCSGDPACRSRCTIEHPVPTENAAPVSALSACLAAKCETACGVACGGFAGYLSEPDAAAGCQSCIQKRACLHASACGTSVECDGLWRCYLACTTEDCQNACVAGHDAGASLARDLYQDYSSVCSTDCDYGGYWACAGTFQQWPAAQSPTVNLTWWVYDNSSQAAVDGGAEVSICTSCPCPSPGAPVLAHGSTDTAGYFTLPVPQTVQSNGVANPLCLQGTAPGYMTTFQYFEFPLSVPTLSIRTSLQPTVAWGLPLLTVSAAMANESALGTTYDPTRGVIGVGVWDCLSGPAIDVYVTLDGGDEGVVVVGAVDAGPGALPTGQSGGASGAGRVVFFNVPPGTVTLTETPQALGRPVDQINVSVAAGTLTALGMSPSPSP